MKEKVFSMMLIAAGLFMFSCKSSKSTVDCTPEREKHVNKMQKIPTPLDTVKQENRPKYN